MGHRIIDSIRAQQRPDTLADVIDRLANRRASEMAIEDRRSNYPTLTSDNLNNATEYQEQRHALHLRTLITDPSLIAEATSLLKRATR